MVMEVHKIVGGIPWHFVLLGIAGVVLLVAIVLLMMLMRSWCVMIVRYVDDRSRSRVAGIRLAVSLGISSFAVWLLGPAVKGVGFEVLLWVMAGCAACTAIVVLFLPSEKTGQEVVA